jgi:hypothetical protein
LNVAVIDHVRAQLMADYTTNVTAQFDIAERIIRRNLDAVGILSLADAPDKLLLWAHYSDNHKGFVVGFNTNHGPLVQRPGEAGLQGLPVPVIYQRSGRRFPASRQSWCFRKIY